MGKHHGPEGRMEYCCCCCCAHKDTALPDRKHHGPEGRTESKICVSRGRNVPSEISYKKLASCCCCWCSWPFKKAASGKETPCYWRAPERPFWNLRQKACYTFLEAGCWLAASCCTAAVALTAASACVCCCLLMLLPAAACGCLLPAAACCLLLPAAPCCCAHKDTARPDGETPWPWRTNRVQNMCFPGPERPFWNLVEKACYTFLDAGYWELLLLLLTLQKGGFRQGNPMLLKGDSDCCCCCAHKDTALPDGETPWPWRTNGVQNRRVPGPERPFWNLLQKACYTFLEAGCWLAASCCTAAVALTAASACVCCCVLMPAAACCCLRLPAACCCLLLPAAACCCCCCWWLLLWCCCCAAAIKQLPKQETATAAAVPTKTLPSRTGKHHGPEGRTESKIGVSRGRNVPSEISYKKLAIRFSRLAAGWLLAAALLPLRLLLRLLVSAAAYWCLLVPAAACCCLRLPAACCCLLLPAAACCWCCCWWLLLLVAAAVVLLLCCCNQTASKARNSYCCCCCCAHKDTALPDGETPWPWPDGETPWPWRTNRVQNRRFPGPERPFWNLLEKACYTFLDAGYWELLLLLVHLTLQKGGFRQGNPMLLKGDSDCCCCCCAHKDTALPDGETPWPWRTNRVQNMRVPGPERPFWNLLQKACYTFLEAGCWLAAGSLLAAALLPLRLLLRLLVSAAAYWCLLLPAAACGCLLPAAACCSLLLRPQRHGPPGRGNTMALKDEQSPKYVFPGAWTSLLKSRRKSLLYVSRCRLLGAAAAAADPSKRRLPARKPHATEGRQRLLLLLLCPQRHGPPGRGNTMALKDEQSPKYACPGAGTSLLKSPSKSLLYVSRGWLLARCWLAASCCTAAVALTAASACVCCCLLMPAAACCCLLPAACCCLLLPAAACCWWVAAAAVVLLLVVVVGGGVVVGVVVVAVVAVVVVVVVVIAGQYLFFPYALPLASAGVGG